VFLLNLPFGLLSFLFMSTFIYDRGDEHPGRFDLFGFGALAVGLTAFRLMLDRGEHQDWFAMVGKSDLLGNRPTSPSGRIVSHVPTVQASERAMITPVVLGGKARYGKRHPGWDRYPSNSHEERTR
jgi:hypothetical protein